MLEKEYPAIVVVPESAVEVRCIASVAKKLNIPTLGIQHGVLSSSNPTYNTNDAEMFPDITVVGGDYWKNMIVNNSKLPSDRVLVMGIPRYDIFAKADEIFDKEKIYNKLNLDKSKKLILWTTSSHVYTKDVNNKLFHTVYNAIKNLRDVQLVIKLHPAERNILMHKGIAKRIGIVPVIVKETDVYELIYACDLMITRGSTTGMEAVALNKPVIDLELTHKSDVIGYVKEGVALGVYKADDLKPAIEKLLKDDSELAKNRAIYIGKYLYKVDGNATERVVNLIEEMIKEYRRDRNEKSV